MSQWGTERNFEVPGVEGGFIRLIVDLNTGPDAFSPAYGSSVIRKVVAIDVTNTACYPYLHQLEREWTGKTLAEWNRRTRDV